MIRALALASIVALTALAPQAGADALDTARAARMAQAPQEAERVLRQALRAQPDRVDLRFEHGVALAETGRCGAAKRAWAQAARLSPTQDVALAVALASRDLCTPRPSGWEKSLTLRGIADSNYTNATTADSITVGGLPFLLSEDAKGQERYGLDVQGSVGYRYGLSPRAAIVPYVQGGVLALNSKADSRIRLGAGIDLDLIGQGWSLRAGPVARGEWDMDGDWVSRYVGLQAFGAIDLDPRNALTLSLAAGRLTHANPLDSGDRWNAEAAWIHRFDHERALRVALALAQADKAPAHRSERETRLSVSYTTPLSPSLGLELAGSVGRITGGGTHPVFAVTRQDEVASLSAGLTLRGIETPFGSPTIGLTHTVSRSNIALHTYDKTNLFVAFTRRF